MITDKPVVSATQTQAQKSNVNLEILRKTTAATESNSVVSASSETKLRKLILYPPEPEDRATDKHLRERRTFVVEYAPGAMEVKVLGYLAFRYCCSGVNIIPNYWAISLHDVQGGPKAKPGKPINWQVFKALPSVCESLQAALNEIHRKQETESLDKFPRVLIYKDAQSLDDKYL
jgi:hypothetical protein